MLCALSSNAVAGKNVRHDDADNTYSYSYDAKDGQITKAQSSTIMGPDPHQVDFYTRIKANPGASVGKRLRGSITLSLYGDRMKVYHGAFRLVVKPETGPASVLSKKRHIVLKPAHGRRKATIRFNFDSPSGDYTMKGRFKAP
jgi:hypothetical protein